MTETKVCVVCNAEKPFEDFRKVKSGDGRWNQCRVCIKAWNKRYRDENPVDIRYRQMWARYALEPERLKAMEKSQKGLCLGCGKPETRTDRAHLSVDHNHATGKVRGLLCDRCNNILGRAQDDPALLVRLAGYVLSDGDPRPSWGAYWLLMAHSYALRADCTRRKVGAILVKDNRLLAGGYNGAPPGQPGCLTDGACPRGKSDVAPGSSYDTGAGSCIAVHAEQNALLRATWDEMAGSTLYVTDEPCDGCLRMIKATPIARIVTPWSEYSL